MIGDGLWQLGVFAANSPDGDGPRRHEVTQTLDPFNEALPLEDGGPLEFGKLDVDFPIDDIGCDEFRWLCVEFKKGEGPAPDFKFETESGEDSIISCKEQPCRGIYFFILLLLSLFCKIISYFSFSKCKCKIQIS